MDVTDAINAIGKSQADDYLLNASNHHANLRTDHPALADLLVTAEAEGHIAAFHDRDKQAIDAQSNYRKWMGMANLGALSTASFGAMAMSTTIMQNQLPELVTKGLSGLATFSAVVGAIAVYNLRSGRLLEAWMRKRASAESHRMSFFESVLLNGAAQGFETAQLSLEYFRRYQFEVQLTYYRARGHQHETSSKRTVLIGAIGAGMATVSGVSGLGADTAWHAATVFGAALGAYAIGREQMTQDSRNAERYDRTHGGLVELSKVLDRVRDSGAEGKSQAVVEFGSAVNSLLSAEHRQWLDETEATAALLRKIESSIQEKKN